MFDPYQKWLGISPEQQPPTFYQLLGVAAEESDPDVIREAALRQTMRLRQYQAGAHARDCARLLNEIAEAQIILLDPEKRSKYDAGLAGQNNSLPEPAPPVGVGHPEVGATSSRPAASRSYPTARPVSPPPAASALEQVGEPAQPERHQGEDHLPRGHRRWLGILFLECAVCLLIGAAVAFWHFQNTVELAPATAPPLASGSASRIIQPSKPARLPEKEPVDKGSGTKSRIKLALDSRKTSNPSPSPLPKPEPETRPAVKGIGEARPAPEVPYQPETRPYPRHSPRGECRPPRLADPRIGVPPLPALARAEKMVREVFQAEYELRKAGELWGFSVRLRTEARATTDDPPCRFVLFREAGLLAGQAGHPTAALAAIDELAREYAVSPESLLAMRTAALESAGRLLTSTSKPIVEAAINVFEQARAADDCDHAARLLKAIELMAKQTRHTAVLAELPGRHQQVENLRKQVAEVKRARATLAVKPDHPPSNLQVGRHLCFVHGDWSAGLPFLSKGSVAELREPAEEDIAGPLLESDQVALADRWWKLADAESGIARNRLQERAVYWYEQALPRLTGLMKSKAEKRAEALAETTPPGTSVVFGSLRDWRDAGEVHNPADWSLKFGKLTGGKESFFWFTPYFSGDFWVSMVFLAGDDSPVLVLAGDSVADRTKCWQLGVNPEGDFRIALPPGQAGAPPATIKVDPGRRVLSVRFLHGDVSIFIDGIQKARWPLAGEQPHRVGLFTESGAVNADSVSFGSIAWGGPRFPVAAEYGPFAGQWGIKLSNKETVDYSIDSLGNVIDGEGKRGLIGKRGADHVIVLGDFVDRIKLVNGQLQVQRFAGELTYPNKVSAFGVGIRK